MIDWVALDGIGVLDSGANAAERGIQPGDLILEVNRKPVGTVPDFMTAYKQSTGKGALLLVYREGRTRYLVLSK